MAESTVAERIAESTWNRLREAQRLHEAQRLYVRLGEETLTDLLVLDFLGSSPSHIKFVQTTKLQEAEQGTDLVVYVRRDANKADIYAVQAKRLSITGRYDSLNHRSGKTQQWQIDVLERYAEEQKAIPLYLLFNYVDDQSAMRWHCCRQTIDKRQFGCTLVPSWQIRKAILKRGDRTFDYIHSDRAALPWRCAFACRNNQTAWDRIREKAEESHRELFSGSRGASLRSFPYDQYTNMDFRSGAREWPSDLWDSDISFPSAEEVRRLYGAPDSQAKVRENSPPIFLPRWIMLVNSDGS